MLALSPEEHQFLTAGYTSGFVILHRQQTPGVIRTAHGFFPEATHTQLLNKLRLQGLAEIKNRMRYTLTPLGKTLVEELQADV